MELDDLVLVSVDDHVVEPPHIFEGRMSARFADLAPRVITQDDGSEAWEFAGQRIVTFGLNAVAGTPPEEYGVDPTRFDQMRPGCYDIHARIDDMNANGVLGSMCFPTFPRFCGQVFQDAAAKDPDLALTALQAYNDWHIDEWAGTYPGRFIPLSLSPLWDPQLMADEIGRVAAKGCHAVTFSENPEKLGLPSLHRDHWDPFWAACESEGTVVCLHIGSSSALPITSTDAPVDVSIVLTPVNAFMALADLLFCPALTKFPNLKIALSEGGIGWVPYLLERCDYVYKHHHAWTGTTLDGKLPSERYREHITTCFIDDAGGIAVKDLIGEDHITWECDYPHSDSTWPDAPEVLWSRINMLPEATIDKITHENAMRVFLFDPFVHRTKERSSAGALRAEARHVDVSVRSMGRGSGGISGAMLAELAKTGTD
jgi:predicted TIM-barrel fold metal-dependent hydrolase